MLSEVAMIKARHEGAATTVCGAVRAGESQRRGAPEALRRRRPFLTADVNLIRQLRQPCPRANGPRPSAQDALLVTFGKTKVTPAPGRGDANRPPRNEQEKASAKEQEPQSEPTSETTAYV